MILGVRTWIQLMYIMLFSKKKKSTLNFNDHFKQGTVYFYHSFSLKKCYWHIGQILKLDYVVASIIFSLSNSRWLFSKGDRLYSVTCSQDWFSFCLIKHITLCIDYICNHMRQDMPQIICQHFRPWLLVGTVKPLPTVLWG